MVHTQIMTDDIDCLRCIVEASRLAAARPHRQRSKWRSRGGCGEQPARNELLGGALTSPSGAGRESSPGTSLRSYAHSPAVDSTVSRPCRWSPRKESLNGRGIPNSCGTAHRSLPGAKLEYSTGLRAATRRRRRMRPMPSVQAGCANARRRPALEPD